MNSALLNQTVGSNSFDQRCFIVIQSAPRFGKSHKFNWLDTIGQPFADEVLRVFAASHSGINIVPDNESGQNPQDDETGVVSILTQTTVTR